MVSGLSGPETYSQIGGQLDPNNYWTITIGHTFSKLYATFLRLWLSDELESRHLMARDQVNST